MVRPSLDAAVTDTHALVYHAAASPRLGSRAAAHFEACERREALLYVPVAVIWEYCGLARGSRFKENPSAEQFFTDLFSNPAYQPIDLTPDQIFDADGLRFTRDPFDALICAAARKLGLPLITRDADISAAGVVDVMW